MTLGHFYFWKKKKGVYCYLHILRWSSSSKRNQFLYPCWYLTVFVCFFFTDNFLFRFLSVLKIICFIKCCSTPIRWIRLFKLFDYFFCSWFLQSFFQMPLLKSYFEPILSCIVKFSSRKIFANNVCHIFYKKAGKNSFMFSYQCPQRERNTMP